MSVEQPSIGHTDGAQQDLAAERAKQRSGDDGIQSVSRARTFFAGQPLASVAAGSMMGQQAPATGAPESVFNASGTGLMALVVLDEVSPELIPQRDIVRQHLMDLAGVASAYVRGEANRQNNNKLVYDTEIWQTVFNNLPLMGPSAFERREFDQQIRGVEIAGEFLETILGFAVGGSLVQGFRTFLQGLGRQIRLGIETGSENYSVGAVTLLIQQQHDVVLGGLKGYFLDFKQSESRVDFWCGSTETFNVSLDYNVATSVFNVGALVKPDVRKEFDEFISGAQLDDVSKAKNFFRGTITRQG